MPLGGVGGDHAAMRAGSPRRREVGENAMKQIVATVVLGLVALTPGIAAAYIGPGAGLSAIGSVLAFLGVVVLLVAGLVWYPVKRFLRAVRAPRADAPAAVAPEDRES